MSKKTASRDKHRNDSRIVIQYIHNHHLLNELQDHRTINYDLLTNSAHIESTQNSSLLLSFHVNHESNEMSPNVLISDLNEMNAENNVPTSNPNYMPSI